MKFIVKKKIFEETALQLVKTNRTYFVQTLGMRTSILSLQKVIYILKPLILGPRSFYKKYSI